MENNNGRGIFYGVIGVATLVVAIIGATFAYFSASAANNNAIKIQSTTVTLSLNDEQFNYYSTMVPVDADDANFKLYPGLTKLAADKSNKGKGTCTDDVGNAICGVYQFTIYNPNETVAQTVFGSLEIKTNDFPLIGETGKTNIHYALFRGTAAQVAAKNGFAVNGTAAKVTDVTDGELVIPNTSLAKTGTSGQTTDWAKTSELLQPKTGRTYTMVVWLEEAGADNSGDQGKMFNAAIKFDTSAGGSGVTGSLSAAAG